MYCTSNLPWLYVYHVISIISFWRDLKWRCSGCPVRDYFTGRKAKKTHFISPCPIGTPYDGTNHHLSTDHAKIHRIHCTVIARNVQEYSRLFGNMADCLRCYGDKRTL